METGELVQRITDDVRTIAHDELELVKNEVGRVAKVAATEAALIVFGGIVTLIGFAMLCTAAVIALEPLIASLALRLVLMAIVYSVLGSVLAGTFAMRLKRDIKPDLTVATHEAKATVRGVKEAVEENPSHA